MKNYAEAIVVRVERGVLTLIDQKISRLSALHRLGKRSWGGVVGH